MMLSLPGSAYIFQGEELGLPDYTTMEDASRRDPTWERSNHQVRGRDSSRVPLPWNAHDANYGFTSGKPWLPQPPDWAGLSVQSQTNDPDSTLSLYRAALRMRREMNLGSGSVLWEITPPRVLGFRNGLVHCWMNTAVAPVELPKEAKILLASSPDQQRETAGEPLMLEPNRTVWFLSVAPSRR